MRAKITPEERFWSRVIKMHHCWIWSGTRRRHNTYGCFEVNGKLISAHRYSWELHNGKIPANLFVLHKCDDKLCVNPDHLFLGTASDNNKDRVAKNRSWHPIGELHPIHKLTEDDVKAIRIEYSTGSISQRALAKKYNVAQWTIGKVVNRKTWQTV